MEIEMQQQPADGEGSTSWVEPDQPPHPVHDPMAGPVGGIMVEGQRSMQEELAALVKMKKQYNRTMIGAGVVVGVLLLTVLGLLLSSPASPDMAAEDAEIARLEAEIDAMPRSNPAQTQEEIERLEAELAAMSAGPSSAAAAGQLVAGIPAPVGTSPDFCFGARSSETYTEIWSENLYSSGNYDFVDTRWRIVDDDPISEPGYWATYLPEELNPTSFAAGQGWAIYQGSNAWGNYPGDNALSGTFLLYDGVSGTRMSELRETTPDMDEFIIEADVMLHDNDGIGFIFGFKTTNDHFTAVEINDQWPSPAADELPGPFQKIHKRVAPLPGQGTCGMWTENGWSAEDPSGTFGGRTCGGSMVHHDNNAGENDGAQAANTAYSLLPSQEGDDGLSVNRHTYTPYPEGPWFKMGLKVIRINRRRGEFTQDVQPSYFITYQSTREDPDRTQSASRGGGYLMERLTAQAQDSLYRGGKIGLFTYASQVTIDNIRITPIGSQHEEPTYCSGAGQCSNEMYSASSTDDIYLGGCPMETAHTFTTQFCGAGESRCHHCTQFDTLKSCMDHCTELGPACGGCTLECHDDAHGGGIDNPETCSQVTSPDCGPGWIGPCPAAGRGPACDPSQFEAGTTPADDSAGCWKYEIRTSSHFSASPYHERSWKKLSYTCLCDEEPHTSQLEGGSFQDLYVFPDCSRSYQDLVMGCMDPAANNYNPRAGKHDHSCIYSFEHGALDFAFSGNFVDPANPMDGHVAIAAGVEALPRRDHTVECWVKLQGVQDWAGPVSFGQDDADSEYGVFLSMRTDSGPDGSLPEGSAYLSYGLSTDGSNDGDGHMTYLGFEGEPSLRGQALPSSKVAGAVVDSSEDAWVHWAGTYDGSTMRLYVDGVLVAEDSVSNSRDVMYPPDAYRRAVDQIHGGWFTLGAYHDANEYIVLNGALDDVRIWERALDPSEMAVDPSRSGGACHPLTGAEAGLLHYFHFDEMVGGKYGDVVQNAVPGGATGFLVGDVKRIEHALCDASGCMDPLAKNYCHRARNPCTTSDHSCQYRWTKGSIHTEPGVHDEATILSEEDAAVLEGFSMVRGHVAVEGIHVGDAAQLPTAAMTAECWVKLDGILEWAGCMSFAQDDGLEEFGFTLSVTVDGSSTARYGFGLATADGTSDDSADGSTQNECAGGRRCGMTYLGSGTPVSEGMGSWHHWAATYDGRTMKVYVDGVLSAEDGSSQRGDLIYPREDYLAMGGGLFTIGAYHDSNEYWPLLGFTDEVRLWNEALPASRIGQNSCRDLVAPLPPTLLGYWKFDEHAGADALNEVAGGSQGVLVGDVLRSGDDVLTTSEACASSGRR